MENKEQRIKEKELSKYIMVAVKCLNDLLRAAHDLSDVEIQINITGYYVENKDKPIQTVIVRLFKEI